jgi:hypothetical protein
MMATNPGAVGAFMNPYVQQSLQPQLNQLAQQGNINAQQAAGAATSAGAFGGSRSALAQNLAQQNALMAQQQAIGQGYNTAYNNAMQNMQYGAGLGLQGQQAAMTGLGQVGSMAGQLGNLGTQQLAAQQGILSAQQAAGATQQQQQQNIINQAVQNYATAQQYPMMQLGNMMDLIRGTPTQTTTTSSYQAAPSVASTLAGLGTTGIAGLGLYNAMSGTSSDIRMKENIVKVDILANGIPVYEFEYRPEFKDDAGRGRYRGVMAQDVQDIMPDAVGTMPNGYLGVNYDMLGIQMELVV